MDQGTRKLMIMHKALSLRVDIDRLYVSRKEGGRGLTNSENSLDAWIREDYINKIKERWLTGIRNINDNINKTAITKKQKWEENNCRDILSDKLTKSHARRIGHGYKRENFKRKTESLLIAAQKITLRTNDVKAKIDKVQQNNKCNLCGERDEMINHISEFSKLVQREYKTRHDWMGKGIHWELCKKLKFDHTMKWCMYKPESILENETYKIPIIFRYKQIP